jgi:transcriptional regulator
MNRRDLLAGLALSAAGLEAQEPQHPGAGSLYIPKPQLVEDRKFLHDFMDEFAFVDLVTTSPTLRITHIPVILDRSAGKYGIIHGHISRQNEQAQAFDGKQSAVLVFHGPQRYISPAWYAKTEAVPTWNFAVVHATGKLKPITEPKALHDLLASLIRKFESYEKSTYDFAKLPDSYVYSMIGGIIGFEMEVELLEGKFKLGQDRSEADRAGILKHLQTAKSERSLYDLTASFYERQKKNA